MADDTLSQEEFDRWTPFPAAYDSIENVFGWVTAKDEIRERLHNGALRAVARLASVKQYDKITPIPLFLLTPSLWNMGGTLTNSDNAWTTGSRIFHRSYPELDVDCRGMKLEPSGLKQILIDAGKDPDSGQHDSADSGGHAGGGSRLDPDEVKRFSTLYLQLWGDDAKELEAWAAIKATYPKNSIGRDYFLGIFRELRGAGKRGNPQFAKQS